MKAIILAAMSAFALQANALVQPAVEIPAQLSCNEIMNVFGNEALESLNLQLSKENTFQPKDSDRFNVDLSDGDQTETFEFKREEIEALTEGRSAKVRGVRIKGYFYADGEHVDSLTVVECQL